MSASIIMYAKLLASFTSCTSVVGKFMTNLHMFLKHVKVFTCREHGLDVVTSKPVHARTANEHAPSRHG